MAGEFEESSTHHKGQAPQCSALYDENVDMELPCYSDCDVAGCENKLQLHLVQVEETFMTIGSVCHRGHQGWNVRGLIRSSTASE